MDLRYLQFTVALFFVERISSLPLGCTYNGTAFGEGETVRTEEPCLFCVCQGGALECSLRVCADQPEILPPGCFFLHKPNECCPQLFCEESFTPPGVELRTGLKLDDKPNGNDCTINGSRYAEGSAVASSQVCEYCYCVEGETKCIKPRCLQSFEGCKAVYEKSSCCPTHYDCRDADMDLLSAQIENFVLANTDPKYSNDTLSIRSSLHSENEKSNSNDSESAENLTEKEDWSREEIGGTTTEDATTEGTTVQPQKEAATPTEDSLTSSGFQTTKAEYLSKESTTVDTTEGTPEPEATTDAPVKTSHTETDLAEASGGPPADNDAPNDSSQEVDDYETYDYGEPRLPPSLPNLVIFPFVAADAVVKDDIGGILDKHDKLEIKRIDTQSVFYKDYFSPPVRTEGGFVPKETFHEQVYFREDQMESPSADPKAGLLCRDILCSLPAIDKQWTKISSATGDVESEKTSFGEDMPPAAEPPTDFIFQDDLSKFQKNQQTKKPVTVAYKNVVVDFYPNYLVTTTRARPKTQQGGSIEVQLPAPAEMTLPGVKIQNAIVKTEYDTSEKLTPSTSTRETLETASTGTTAAASSFFDEFFKSFLSEDIMSSTTTTTTTKHKYSSKIKSHANAVPEDGGQKGKAEVSKTPTDSVSNVLIRTEESTTPFRATDTLKLEHTSDVPAEEITRGTGELFQGGGKEKTSSQKGKQDGYDSREETNSLKPDAGALLKLAGCNIYGMMYRVGKLITELSGPCLECLCTDLGVQCRPLGC